MKSLHSVGRLNIFVCEIVIIKSIIQITQIKCYLSFVLADTFENMLIHQFNAVDDEKKTTAILLCVSVYGDFYWQE